MHFAIHQDLQNAQVHTGLQIINEREKGCPSVNFLLSIAGKKKSTRGVCYPFSSRFLFGLEFFLLTKTQQSVWVGGICEKQEQWIKLFEVNASFFSSKKKLKSRAFYKSQLAKIHF